MKPENALYKRAFCKKLLKPWKFKSVPQYFNSTEEEERKLARETEKVLIQNVLNEELYDKLINITDAMHDAAMSGLSEISDDELAGVLIGSFNSLNKFGKFC